jgi:hypothetical protein
MGLRLGTGLRFPIHLSNLRNLRMTHLPREPIRRLCGLEKKKRNPEPRTMNAERLPPIPNPQIPNSRIWDLPFRN